MSAFAQVALIFGGSTGYVIDGAHGGAIGLAIVSGIFTVLSFFGR